MKKDRITFGLIVSAELIAIILSLVVFHGIYSFLTVAVLTLELLVGAGWLIHNERYDNQLEMLLLSFAFATVIASLWQTKLSMAVIPIVVACMLVVMFTVFGKYKTAEKNEKTVFCDSQLFSDKSVLLIVPHQDDDINLMGGMIEEFINNKSDVHICFYTNGDFEIDAEIRLSESLRVADYYGIPHENIIFMGYGDRWSDEVEHIYNFPNGELATSASGEKATYALSNHAAYNDGADYKRENVVNDMKNIILDLHPTDIFCVDYDCHPDHIACSLFFEEAMHEILKSNEDYRPRVYKGYAYETAFFSDRDYFRLNALSTVNGRRTAYMKKYTSFNWHDRIRFPVSPGAVTRFIENNSVYKALSLYKSQEAIDHAESIINGDKIFWKRRTDSVLYNAEITVSSGRGEVLNDFKLIDTNRIGNFPMCVVKNLNVPDSQNLPTDGIWIPDAADDKKEIAVVLKSKTDIKSICLYDNPSRTDNIINAELRFDNGTVIETGPLNPDGSATHIETNIENVSSFVLKITDWDGDNPGLSELEAYESGDKLQQFIKLTDDADNFIYNYIIESGNSARLSVYSYGVPELQNGNYSVSVDNDRCSAEIKEDYIEVHCPSGEACVISVCSDNGIEDKAKISNPKDKKLIKTAIVIDCYRHRILRPNSQKNYYKNMLLFFWNRLFLLIGKLKRIGR